MSRSLILQTAARVLLPLMLVLSIVVLLRGHNAPGGGFVGGLLAASGFSLYALSFSASEARRLLRVSPLVLLGIGLIAAVVSGLLAMAQGSPFLEGRWASVPVPGFPEPLKVGTPLLFDVGVYLVVLSGTFLMALSLEEVGDATAVRR
ncbi:MAG: Na+/H+ antiporter subunit B [Phycisphaerales bacterium]